MTTVSRFFDRGDTRPEAEGFDVERKDFLLPLLLSRTRGLWGLDNERSLFLPVSTSLEVVGFIGKKEVGEARSKGGGGVTSIRAEDEDFSAFFPKERGGEIAATGIDSTLMPTEVADRGELAVLALKRRSFRFRL